MRQLDVKKDPFLWGVVSFWLIATFIVALFSKSEIHLYCNQFHMPVFDWFFRNITWLGDGVLIVLVALVFALFRVRYGLLVLSTYLGSGIFVQLMKRLLFSDVQRPKAFFEGVADLYFVPGVDVHTSKSFPSGHTTSAFAFFACFALLSNSKYAKAFFFILALLTGYSRIYLSQHFLVDVLVGSFIGTLTTYALYPLFSPNRVKWMDFSFVKRQ